MEGQINYMGAAIFWLYIIAALVLTALIVYTLFESERMRTRDSSRNGRAIVTFGALAVASFGTLSINMLNVLIQSFNSWSERRQSFSSSNIGTAVWQWSLTSTLFQDFAEALVAADARYLWSEAALLATFAVSTFMSIEGRRYNVPRLWAFFSLSQILPVSFTQNLFYLALLQHRGSAQPSAVPLQTLRLLRYLIAAYCGCLLILPLAASGPYLMPLVLLTRVMLSLPLLLPAGDKDDSSSEVGKTKLEVRKSRKVRRDFQTQIVLSVTACILIQGYTAFNSGSTLGMLTRTLFEHPAVSSLGCDMILSIVSAIIWRGMQEPADQPPPRNEDHSRGAKSGGRNISKPRAA